MRSRITRALLYFPFYVLTFALASVLWERPLLLAGCYLAMSVFMLWRWHRPSDLAYFFLALALGPLGEMAAVSRGAWTYAQPAFLVPLWLPLAWGISGLFLKKTVEALTGPSDKAE